MKPKLSFVIPVYNVETYLRTCVESIICQMEDDCEIVLVDDGSTDQSGVLCDRIAEGNKQISVIHQKNQGLSGARNTGLCAARGDYIAFVDSDDYIDSHCLNEIRHYISGGGSDICFLRANKLFPDGAVEDLGDSISQDELRGKSQAEVWSYLASRPKYPGSACTKVFRRAFLEKHHLRFPEKKLSEDLVFCMEALLKAESFDALDIPYYFYRQNRTGSITSKVSKKTCVDLSYFIGKYAEMLAPGSVAENHVNKCAMAFVAYEYMILLLKYGRIEDPDKREILLFLKKYRWSLRYGASNKVKLVNLAVSVCGIRATARLLSLYSSIVRE